MLPGEREVPDEADSWWDEHVLSTPNPLEQLTGPAFNDDESLRILGMVAVTVTRLADLPPGEDFSVPYHAVAQMTVDRICLAGLRRFPHDRRGDDWKYPRSLPDLLAWCREREIQEWNFLDLPTDLPLRGKLLDPETLAPSPLCQELALRYKYQDPVGKSISNLLIKHIREMYAQAGSPGRHAIFIRELVKAPVLTFAGFARLKVSRMRIPEKVIDTCYGPVDDRYFDERGRANVCASCGLLRVRMRQQWRCEITTCPDRRWSQGGEPLERADGLYHARRPLREFLIAPLRIRESRENSSMMPDPPRDLEG